MLNLSLVLNLIKLIKYQSEFIQNSFKIYN